MKLIAHIARQPFLILSLLILVTSTVWAENKVLGEVDFEGATNLEQDSGVWVDGQYLGYLKELKGSKKVLLLPGKHEIMVKHDGYKDFTQAVNLQPAEKQLVRVTLEKDFRYQMPSVTAEIKLSVDPDRAAVFVDGLLVGHAGELGGVGKSLLVAPGKRRITIKLPGYQTFETELELAPQQKFSLKTKLVKVTDLPEPAPPQ
ncbi:MAG: PEGA domain-containing protein [Terriglobales bacterium]